MQREGKLKENQQFMEGQYIIRVKDKEKQMTSRRISVDNRDAFSPKSVNEYMTKTPRNLQEKFASTVANGGVKGGK